eukprot:TRINITY_DN65250_c0_g1_i1.p3 TRINITY_DN65250_c0_g1~~TRINITY_DN65250_c0_g1_i1.p3  ORF type:complete len:215 (-),score=13.72 TRINITY_DN65250_c0_g1_i1:101-745(-)
MRHIAKILALTAILFVLATGRKGADVSQLFPDISCLKSKGFELIIPRCYHSYGAVDKNCPKNLAHAKAAGLSADIYIFPCSKCGNPAKQVEDTIKYVKSEVYGRIWVDVERYHWNTDKAVNRKFIREMVNAIEKAGKKAGIYTSTHSWNAIVGNDWDELSRLPLWYPHYDKHPSFKDFKSFGGWHKPLMKQYVGNEKVCGGTVDLNYFEQQCGS